MPYDPLQNRIMLNATQYAISRMLPCEKLHSVKRSLLKFEALSVLYSTYIISKLATG